MVVDLGDHGRVGVAHPIGQNVYLDVGVAAPGTEAVAQVIGIDFKRDAGTLGDEILPGVEGMVLLHVGWVSCGVVDASRENTAVLADDSSAELREERDRAHGLGSLADIAVPLPAQVLVQGDRVTIEIDITIDIYGIRLTRAQASIEHEHGRQVHAMICTGMDGGALCGRD